MHHTNIYIHDMRLTVQVNSLEQDIMWFQRKQVCTHRQSTEEGLSTTFKIYIYKLKSLCLQLPWRSGNYKKRVPSEAEGTAGMTRPQIFAKVFIVGLLWAVHGICCNNGNVFYRVGC